MKHVIVYHEAGRFGGWPANHGVWNWGDEILVGFSRNWFEQKADEHSVDRTKPDASSLARSRDGGETWTIQDLPAPKPPVPSPGGIDFAHPDFALRVRNNAFQFSYDRGRSWQGPFLLPDFGIGELSARTDYLVRSKDDCLLFLSAKFSRVAVAGEDLRDRAFCARTTDGGKTFRFVGWMTGEPVEVRSVMPATIRSDRSLVSLLRRRLDLGTEFRNDLNWIDAYGSEDEGANWAFLARVAFTDTTMHNGNPPSLVALPDGRLAAAYGVRSNPSSIRARISRDHGRTWGRELILRDDSRTWDMGYCRSVVRADGKIVTMYYYATKANFENHIAATIWSPIGD